MFKKLNSKPENARPSPQTAVSPPPSSKILLSSNIPLISKLFMIVWRRIDSDDHTLTLPININKNINININININLNININMKTNININININIYMN